MYQVVESKVRAGGDQWQRRGGRGKPEKTAGAWGWFFFKVILFLGLVGGSYVGYTMYRANQPNSRF